MSLGTSKRRSSKFSKVPSLAQPHLARPFIIDLESTNSTHVNSEAIPTSRYYELQASDGPFLSPTHPTATYVHSAVIKFGDSPREYVLLHDEAS